MAATSVVEDPTRKQAVGPRTIILGAVAALSVFDPSLATLLGGIGGVTILLFSNLARLKITSEIGWMTLLVAWTALTGLWSVNPHSTNVTLIWVSLGVMFIAGLHLIQTRAQLLGVVVGYIIGTFFAAIRLMLENPSLFGASAFGRVTTIFDDLNINYLAYALATGFALVVLLWRVRRRRTLGSGLALWATALAIVAGTFLTQSRGAILGIGFALLWLLVWRLFKARTLVAITVVLLVSTVVLVSGAADQASLQLETGDRATGSWSGRLPLWDSARDLWEQSPLFGFGASGFGYASGYLIAAHNVIFDLAVGVGAVGLVLYLLLIRSSIWKATKTIPSSDRSLIVGTFIAVSAPIYLTGAWVTAPAAWVAIVLIARVASVYASPPAAVGQLERRPGFTPNDRRRGREKYEIDPGTPR